jgi:hypothetical protein
LSTEPDIELPMIDYAKSPKFILKPKPSREIMEEQNPVLFSRGKKLIASLKE